MVQRKVYSVVIPLERFASEPFLDGTGMEPLYFPSPLVPYMFMDGTGWIPSIIRPDPSHTCSWMGRIWTPLLSVPTRPTLLSTIVRGFQYYV